MQALHKSNGALAIEQPRVGAKYPMVGSFTAEVGLEDFEVAET